MATIEIEIVDGKIHQLLQEDRVMAVLLKPILNQERRHSSIGYVLPREHLGQTLDTLESEPQTAAPS